MYLTTSIISLYLFSTVSLRRWLTTESIVYSEIQFKEWIDRGAHGQVFWRVWQGNDVVVKNFPFGCMRQKEMDALIFCVYVNVVHPVSMLMSPNLSVLVDSVFCCQSI